MTTIDLTPAIEQIVAEKFKALEKRINDQELLIEEITSALEDMEDRKAIMNYNADNSFPEDVFERIEAGENTVRVLREYRGMSQSALADKAGITVGSLSHIETGKRKGSITVLKSLAETLGTDMDMMTYADE